MKRCFCSDCLLNSGPFPKVEHQVIVPYYLFINEGHVNNQEVGDISHWKEVQLFDKVKNNTNKSKAVGKLQTLETGKNRYSDHAHGYYNNMFML